MNKHDNRIVRSNGCPTIVPIPSNIKVGESDTFYAYRGFHINVLPNGVDVDVYFPGEATVGWTDNSLEDAKVEIDAHIDEREE